MCRTVQALGFTEREIGNQERVLNRGATCPDFGFKLSLAVESRLKGVREEAGKESLIAGDRVEPLSLDGPWQV